MKIIRCRCYHQAAVCCKELMRHWYNTQGQSVSFAQLDNVLPPTEATVSKFIILFPSRLQVVWLLFHR